MQSVVFKEEQGSFLVGMLAAMASKTGKVGFVGGMDIPLIHKFGCGYQQGVKYASAKTGVMQNMIGTTAAAWTDPVKGGELAKSQMDQGADVVYAAAGGLRDGRAARRGGCRQVRGRRRLRPERALPRPCADLDAETRRCRVDKTFTDAKNGTWKAGVQVLGLKEDGVGYALDQFNKPLLTPAMLKAVDDAKADIISGKVAVHDYMADSKCPE